MALAAGRRSPRTRYHFRVFEDFRRGFRNSDVVAVEQRSSAVSRAGRRIRTAETLGDGFFAARGVGFALVLGRCGSGTRLKTSVTKE